MINSDSALFKCHDTASAVVLWDDSGDKALRLGRCRMEFQRSLTWKFSRDLKHTKEYQGVQNS
jgi:hypothetical protein